MSDDPQPSAVLGALEQAITDLYAKYDGRRLFATYAYRTPGGDLQSGEFIIHIGEDVLTSGAQALLEEFEQELLEQALRQWEGIGRGRRRLCALRRGHLRAAGRAPRPLQDNARR